MLINLRNALMAGKRLPYDAEVEFLESTGTQWIDTGIATSYSAKIEVTFLLHQVATQAVFGCRVTSGTGVFFGTSSTGAVYCNNGNSALSPALNLSAETIYSVIQKGNAVTVNGNNYFTSGAANSTASMLLFARREEGGASRIIHGRIYSWRVYDGNGNLVQDAIPVRKGTVGYLYDRVSGRLFGNAGSGAFSYGSDVVPVAYIESHGTEYIDTGVRGAGSGYLATTFQPLNVGSSSTYWRYFGASNGDTRTERTIAYNAGGRTIFENGYNQFVLGTSRGDVYTIQKTGYNVPSGSAVGDKNFQIFGYNGTYNIGNVRFYNFSLWDSNNILVRSFSSIRVGTGSTWEGAMMDTLTRRIYRNAGTGAFAYGNDLKYPIPAE